MSTPLDVLTRGLGPATGLALATRGFLVEQGSFLGDLPSAALSLAPGVMTDIAFHVETARQELDVRVQNGDLIPERGLLTAVVMSLFTDRRAETDDPLPDSTGDLRGWWGDGLGLEGDQVGSRLWLLARAKAVPATLRQAREFCREALDWLVEDQVAKSVRVDAAFHEEAPTVMRISIELTRQDDTSLPFRFLFLWQNLGLS